MIISKRRTSKRRTNRRLPRSRRKTKRKFQRMRSRNHKTDCDVYELNGISYDNYEYAHVNI